jgi:hypothetical protein
LKISGLRRTVNQIAPGLSPLLRCIFARACRYSECNEYAGVFHFSFAITQATKRAPPRATGFIPVEMKVECGMWDTTGINRGSLDIAGFAPVAANGSFDSPQLLPFSHSRPSKAKFWVDFSDYYDWRDRGDFDDSLRHRLPIISVST